MRSLKEEMERVWKEWPCLSPLHLISWNTKQIGYSIGWGLTLCWEKGTLMYLKIKRRNLWRKKS